MKRGYTSIASIGAIFLNICRFDLCRGQTLCFTKCYKALLGGWDWERGFIVYYIFYVVSVWMTVVRAYCNSELEIPLLHHVYIKCMNVLSTWFLKFFVYWLRHITLNYLSNLSKYNITKWPKYVWYSWCHNYQFGLPVEFTLQLLKQQQQQCTSLTNNKQLRDRRGSCCQ